ncbi:MAG: sigma-70 family RNA polymerase sigma factor [Bacteroidota bacterium]|nr:sigma-70 family RNA polymerase sigma factor [Bacteroidota bacterium]MDP4206111.1 sigma-70 family RNA polymerase sigma factor [Bacteroidota bacterium]
MEEEFVDIITKNQGIIHKVCCIYCDDEEDRKDLFQEVVVQLWRSFPSFRNESKFSTWMYRVAINTAITSFKRGKRLPQRQSLPEQSIQIVDDVYDPETEDKIKLLYQSVSKLSGIEKSIILLYLESKTYEEIAEITGITQNYVRVKMNRVKKKLKKLMNIEE